jgi:glycosyltransferase involved in cell wall biosynthesis
MKYLRSNLKGLFTSFSLQYCTAMSPRRLLGLIVLSVLVLWSHQFLFETSLLPKPLWRSIVVDRTADASVLKSLRLELPENSTLVWSLNYCGQCTGFAVEAYDFVIPLAESYAPGAMGFANGNRHASHSKCTCPGYSRTDVALLERASAAMPALTRRRIDVWVEHQPPPVYPRFVGAYTTSTGLVVRRRPLWVVGRSMCEAQRVRADWVPHLKRVDEVWVPSRFLIDAFASAGAPREKLVLIPEAVHPAFFETSLPSLFERDQCGRADTPNRFVFLAVGKWEARKGLDELVAAYVCEFDSRDPVVLVLKTFLFQQHDGKNEAKVRAHATRVGLNARAQQCPRVRGPLPAFKIITGRDIGVYEMAELYSSAHAFVLPTRAEGWCLPCTQALAAGLPTIVTNWSGPADFMSDDHSFPLSISGVGPARGKFWTRDQHWAVPNATHLRALMRDVYANHGGALARGVRARAFARAHYDRARVATAVAQRLRAIVASLPFLARRNEWERSRRAVATDAARSARWEAAADRRKTLEIIAFLTGRS